MINSSHSTHGVKCWQEGMLVKEKFGYTVLTIFEVIIN